MYGSLPTGTLGFESRPGVSETLKIAAPLLKSEVKVLAEGTVKNRMARFVRQGFMAFIEIQKHWVSEVQGLGGRGLEFQGSQGLGFRVPGFGIWNPPQHRPGRLPACRSRRRLRRVIALTGALEFGDFAALGLSRLNPKTPPNRKPLGP